MIYINSLEEYNYVVSRGFNPLLNYKDFKIDINLRVDLQKELFNKSIFGRGDVVRANTRFYKYIWENKPHHCEECNAYLANYSPVYCSHILTRGAYPEMAHDPRNVNILCFKHHSQWENGNRKAMRINRSNEELIGILKQEYNVERKNKL